MAEKSEDRKTPQPKAPVAKPEPQVVKVVPVAEGEEGRGNG